MKVTIHCEPGIPWQAPFAAKMSRGLHALHIPHVISGDRSRQSDVAILLGTSMWRAIEANGKYLLVDRCSMGDTNQWVSLVWNGHGRRGDHKAPRHPKPSRLRAMIDNGVIHLYPWNGHGHKVVLCGQTESYSPKWPYLPDWYASVDSDATHFRPHPAQPVNPTLLPEWLSFSDCARFLTLNSSVAVDAILRGIPTVVEDEGGMAWPGHQRGDDRVPWLRWLAYTQWHHGEIEEGSPIRHLFEGI